VFIGGLFWVYSETVLHQTAGSGVELNTWMKDFWVGELSSLSKQEFIRKTKNSFFKDETVFIEADLVNMRLWVYRGDKPLIEAPIASKGKNGSWWETSTGLYWVESKQKNHFSSIGHVYMPYSMQFQGNFFIHGWPYYPNGREVESAFSGGCIRLRTSDAKEVFSMINIGVPVLVIADDPASDLTSYRPVLPELTADAYLVADIQSGFVFMKKNESAVSSISFITQFFTALTASEFENLDSEVRITSRMMPETLLPRFAVGQDWRVADLFYIMLMESSAEAGYALAHHYSGGPVSFVGLMNRKASAIGLTQTRFIDPAGLGNDNVSSAEDLFGFLRYLFQNKEFLLAVSAGQWEQFSYWVRPQLQYLGEIQNRNLFSDDKDFVGGKFSKTSDGSEVFIGIFYREFAGTKRPIGVVLLGSDNVKQDAEMVLQSLTSFSIIQ
jgi:D-alanyl-D-alanine carboxypeptidase